MHDPQVPETLEGWSLLHQMFRVRWPEWRELPAADRRAITEEAAGVLGGMTDPERGPTALTTLLGHKGDLMLLHCRRDFPALQEAQLACRLALARLTRQRGAEVPPPIRIEIYLKDNLPS